MTRHQEWTSGRSILCLIIVYLLLGAQGTQPFARDNDLSRVALSDLQVLYLYDDVQSIDWGSLYFLNDWYGARIDLVAINSGERFQHQLNRLQPRQLFSHAFMVPGEDAPLDSVTAALFEFRRPDIVLISRMPATSLVGRFAAQLAQLPVARYSLFEFFKTYREMDSLGSSDGVSINSREMAQRYRERMEREIPILLPRYDLRSLAEPALRHWELTINSLGESGSRGDFCAGLGTNRLGTIISHELPNSAIRSSLSERVKAYLTSVDMAGDFYGRKRAEHLLRGLRELRTLRQQCRAEARLSAIHGFDEYFRDQVDKLQDLVLSEIGLRWAGEIALRESPDGTRVKFIATLAADGPTPIELTQVRFHPYWDSVAVVLENEPKNIEPHQSFVREYLLDISPARLEAQGAETLQFSASLAYGNMSFEVQALAPLRKAPDLSVTFVPDFLFIPPVADLNVDKVVDSRTWKAIIAKPPGFSGSVQLQLETPRGIFAGAYQTERKLERDELTQTVRIPFTVSNLFELGIQPVTLGLYESGRRVAADTAIIRVASCEIEKKRAVGFLPDSTGLLEDILRMTGVGFQPLTDHALIASDLDVYDVIIIGSGAAEGYPSLHLARDRFADYLRHGGSLVVLGQPSGWSHDVLPVRFVPGREHVSGTQILNRLQNAAVLNRPYAVSDRGLLDALGQGFVAASAVMSPAELVYVTPSGATLLAVSRLDEGQMIYCGLPLTHLVSRLNIEAIHLLANLLNY